MDSWRRSENNRGCRLPRQNWMETVSTWQLHDGHLHDGKVDTVMPTSITSDGRKLHQLAFWTCQVHQLARWLGCGWLFQPCRLHWTSTRESVSREHPSANINPTDINPYRFGWAAYVSKLIVLGNSKIYDLHVASYDEAIQPRPRVNCRFGALYRRMALSCRSSLSELERIRDNGVRIARLQVAWKMIEYFFHMSTMVENGWEQWWLVLVTSEMICMGYVDISIGGSPSGAPCCTIDISTWSRMVRGHHWQGTYKVP